MALNPLPAAEGLAGTSPAERRSSLVTIRTGGSKKPLFFLPDIGGGVQYARRFVAYIDSDRPLYGFRPVIAPNCPVPDSIEAMVQAFVLDLSLAGFPRPYHLVGHSFAAFVAFETARQLAASNEDVGLVALLDAEVPERFRNRERFRSLASQFCIDMLRWSAHHFSPKAIGSWKIHLRSMTRLILQPQLPEGSFIGRGFRQWDLSKFPQAQRDLILSLYDAKTKYMFGDFPGRVVVYRALIRQFLQTTPADLGWSRFAKGGVRIFTIPGNHMSLLNDDRITGTVAKSLVENAESIENERGAVFGNPVGVPCVSPS
jgi:thioesterase domain-containing protein